MEEATRRHAGGGEQERQDGPLRSLGELEEEMRERGILLQTLNDEKGGSRPTTSG